MRSVFRDPNQKIQRRAEGRVEIGSRRGSGVKGRTDKVGNKGGTKVEEFIGQAIEPRRGIAESKEDTDDPLQGGDKTCRKTKGVK